MLHTDQERQRPKQPPHGFLLLVLPLLIVFLLAVGLRILRDKGSATTNVAAQNAARSLVGPELHRLRTELDRTNAHAAKKAAEDFAEKHLFPPGRETVQDITVTSLKRARYRVRGKVSYRDRVNRLVSRHFEADLLHGPTDDVWRLVDTEFLP